MLRRLLRRYVPFELRLLIRLGRRRLADRRNGALRLARGKLPSGGRHPFPWADYQLPFIDYPGQEHLAGAKRSNQRLMAQAMDCAVIAPGETFSFWAYAGRPTAKRDYQHGAALKEGKLTTDIGGGTCLLATVVYNLGLLSGMEVTERWVHSVDNMGAARYFELGRDAAVEFGYRDLRLRNPFDVPLALHFEVTGDYVRGIVTGGRPRPFGVEILVSEPQVTPFATIIAPRARRDQEGIAGVRTKTVRRLRFDDGRCECHDLGESIHQVRPRILTRRS